MPEKLALKSYIDIVMISRLGVSDGGRETWLYNFMAEVSKQRPDIGFRIFSMPLSENNIFAKTDIRHKLDIEHVEIPCVVGRIPLTISFILKFPGIYRRHLRTRIVKSLAVVGVGGLGESLAVFFGGAPIGQKKIMWLRTVYTREKFDRIPRQLMPSVKLIEESLLKKGFNIVIANGDDTAAYYRTCGICCEVIHNAVQLQEYYGASRAPQGKLAIAFVGRLSAVKGIGEFLAAVTIARTSGLLEKVEFHIAGVGDLQNQVQVQQLHDQGLLHYHGAINNRDMPNFLASIDCCVALTSFTESLGGGGVSNALIEQMAARKIIVAWDNIIFRNSLYDDECFFVEQGDADALHKCLSYIVAHPNEAQCRALSACEGVKRYDITSHVRKFFEVLDA